jgi:hypothetical protein
MIRRLSLAIVLLLALPGVANAELLASSADDGDAPVAALDFALLGPKGPMRVKARSSPVNPLALVVDLRCHRGAEEGHRRIRVSPQRGSVDRRVGLPIHGPDTCFVSVRARFDGHVEGGGRISLKVYGRAQLAPPL